MSVKTTRRKTIALAKSSPFPTQLTQFARRTLSESVGIKNREEEEERVLFDAVLERWMTGCVRVIVVVLFAFLCFSHSSFSVMFFRCSHCSARRIEMSPGDWRDRNRLVSIAWTIWTQCPDRSRSMCWPNMFVIVSLLPFFFFVTALCLSRVTCAHTRITHGGEI